VGHVCELSIALVEVTFPDFGPRLDKPNCRSVRRATIPHSEVAGD
jgi:hypothetical protein